MKIGVMSDMSSLYSDIGGPGSTAAAKLAIADFTKNNPNVKVELVSADHQNKADVGSSVVNNGTTPRTSTSSSTCRTPASRWRSARSRATKNKVFIVSGAAASDLTGPKCNANTVHWTYDTWMLANGTGKALVKTGGDSWFFLTADYAFGHALERDTAAAVEANGGKVLGKVRHPLNTNDFSSFLLQAQTSKAKIIGLANAGGDTINSIKAGAEFGIVTGRAEVRRPPGVRQRRERAWALQTAQGLTLTETWYWDMNDANRAWTKRWQAERPGKFPTMVQAGVYSGVTHYLKAVAALKSAADGKAVVAKMKRAADRRSAVRQGHDPRRRPQGARRLSVRGEEAVGIQVSGRLLSSARHDPGGGSVPSLKDGGCPLVERLTPIVHPGGGAVHR